MTAAVIASFWSSALPPDKLTSPVPVPLLIVTFGYPAVSGVTTAVPFQAVTLTGMSVASAGYNTIGVVLAPLLEVLTMIQTASAFISVLVKSR